MLWTPAFPPLQGEEALPLADCACAVKLKFLGPEVLRAFILLLPPPIGLWEWQAVSAGQ